MEFAVLGPLRVVRDGVPVEIPGNKERMLLGHLVAQCGRTVPVAALIESLWGEEPPRSAAKSVQTFVLRVRTALEPDRQAGTSVLVTDAGGYRLAVRTSQVDAHRFTELAALGHAALEEGRHESAVSTLREALALWRGPAYAGLDHTPYGAAEGRRLEELRVAALEDRWRAELEVGHVDGVVGQLEQLVDEHPYRERLWALLVLALYRADRQGDALAAYERARARLDDDLGVQPGDELRRLHAGVLRQDPALRPARPVLPSALVEPRRPMHGRDRELELLESAWRRALDGEAVSVVVRGPAGAGATRLAAALAARAVGCGRPVVHATDRPVPVPAGGLLVSRVDAPAALPGSMVLRLGRPDTPLPADAVALDLRPLPEAAVREVVASYVAPGDVDPATEFVLRAAPPWPGAVHDAAVGWARDTARARVAAGAARLDEATARVDGARAEVVDGVVALGTTRAAAPARRDVCPWRGLATYDVDDAAWYAGRERLVAELLARVSAGRLVAVVGASGSGKSSLLRAGLLAGLRDGRLPGSADWATTLVRPGEHPMRELARNALGLAATGGGPRRQGAGPPPGDVLAGLLDGLPRQDRTVLVVDQLEEAWTLCAESEREELLELLADLVEQGPAVTVVLGLRADFLGRLAEHPRLAAQLGDDTVLVGPPTRAEVERAIGVPAAAAGLELEVGLADALVTDAGDEPGLLPLLSVALVRLWEERADDRLTLASYVTMGGLSGAIARLAEDAWAALPEEERPTARTVLLRLAGDDAGSAVVRRRASQAELEHLPGDVRPVVDHLVQARLLSTTDGQVEVAHESLFREWPRLARWLEEDAADRSVLHRLAEAAREWDAEGREAAHLWRGTRLDAGLEVAQDRPDGLTGVERDFLEAGREAARAEQRESEERAARAVRQNRRLRGLLVGVAVLLVLALVAGVLAWLSRQEASEASDSALAAATRADARRLAAQAVAEDQHDLALLQAVEAVRVDAGPDTYGALLNLLGRAPDLLGTLRTPRARFLRAASSPDGGTVFLADQLTVWAVDAVSRDVLWTERYPLSDQELAQPGVLAAGPPGLAVPLIGAGGGGVALVDPATGEEKWRISSEELSHLVLPDMPPFFDGAATWYGDDALLIAYGGRLLLLAAEDGRVLRSVPLGIMPGHVLAWPDGRVSFSDGPGRGRIVDLAAPRPRVRPLPGVVLAVSPDGGRVVTTDSADPEGRTLHLRDASLQRLGGDIALPAWSEAVSWARDGETFAVAVDEQVLVRDGHTGAARRTLSGAHGGAVIATTYAADDTVLWAAGRDGLATAWDLTGRRGVIAARTVPAEPHTGDQSTGGTLAAYVHFHSGDLNEAAVADLSRDARPRRLEQPRCDLCQVTAVAMLPEDAGALGLVHQFEPGFSALEDDRGWLVRWSVADGRILDQVRLPWRPFQLDTTPDGTRAVVNGLTGHATVDLATLRIVGGPVPADELVTQTEVVAQVAVSPDGSEAVLVRDGEVLVVDPASGARLREATVAAEDVPAADGGDFFGLTAVAWSPDGEHLVVGSFTGSVYVLDADTLREVAPARSVVDGWVTQATFGGGGEVLATLGTDGDVLLWDTVTWTPLGQPVVEDGTWGVLRFDADTLHGVFEGEEGDGHGTRRTLDLDPDAWVAEACRLAHRELTPEEWAVIHPEEEWRPTCGRD